MVFGSANASDGGVGFASDAKLVEAAVLHPPAGKAYAAAGAWFEDLWDRAAQVDAQVLGQARVAWARTTTVQAHPDVVRPEVAPRRGLVRPRAVPRRRLRLHLGRGDPRGSG